jgi:hypothetical protein
MAGISNEFSAVKETKNCLESRVKFRRGCYEIPVCFVVGNPRVIVLIAHHGISGRVSDVPLTAVSLENFHGPGVWSLDCSLSGTGGLLGAMKFFYQVLNVATHKQKLGSGKRLRAVDEPR